MIKNNTEMVSNNTELRSNMSEMFHDKPEMMSNGNEMMSNGNEMMSNHEMMSNDNETNKENMKMHHNNKTSADMCIPQETVIENVQLAQAYVPIQKLCTTFSPERALMNGTAFPPLYDNYSREKGLKVIEDE